MTTITKLPDPVAGGSKPPHRGKTLRAGRGRRLGDLRIALLFILPAMIGFVAFFLVPTIRGVYLSFTEYSVLGDPTWIGTRNYTAILRGRAVLERHGRHPPVRRPEHRFPDRSSPSGWRS